MNNLMYSPLICTEQKNRISKCHYQTIYLLEKIVNNKDNIILKLTGSTLNIYTITINDSNVTCNCPDSNVKHEKLFCKHICFVVCVIGKIYDIDTFVNKKLCEEQRMDIIFNITRDNTITNHNTITCNYLTEKYLNMKFKAINDAKNKDLEIRNIKDECTICFNNMENEKEIYTCKNCFNAIHKECLKIWIREKNTCIFCRSYINVCLTENNSYLNISK
jgi:uncharacterized Zn finger protein